MPTYIKLLFLFLFCTQACTKVQETSSKTSGFELTGSFTTIPDSVTVLVLITNMDTDDIDSTYVINGEFKFKGQVGRPTPYNFIGINTAENRVEFHMQVFIENEVITMKQKEKYGKTIVTGSKSYDEKSTYYQGLRKVWNKYEVVLEKEELNQQDSLEIERYIKEIKEAKIEFYTKNPNSYFTGYQMMYETLRETTEFNVNLSKRELSEIYPQLSNEVKNSIYGMVINRYISKPDIPQVGEQYLDFILPTANGVKVKLSDFEGKYILVDFWASWCGPCRAQNPNLTRLYKKYKTNNFEILGVSIDKQKNKWLKALKEDSLIWTNVLSEGGWFSEVSQLYGINGIPDNLLINPDGIIINRNLKDDELAELLETIFEKE